MTCSMRRLRKLKCYWESWRGFTFVLNKTMELSYVIPINKRLDFDDGELKFERIEGGFGDE